MKIVSEMEKPFGDCQFAKYSVIVFRQSDRVDAQFHNLESGGLIRGGRLHLPADVAARFAHALLLASSGENSDPIWFQVSEEAE